MICDVFMEASFYKHVDQNDIIFPNKIRCFVNSGRPANGLVFHPWGRGSSSPFLVLQWGSELDVRGFSN